jgi:hypothetical protein
MEPRGQPLDRYATVCIVNLASAAWAQGDSFVWASLAVGMFGKRVAADRVSERPE